MTADDKVIRAYLKLFVRRAHRKGDYTIFDDDKYYVNQLVVRYSRHEGGAWNHAFTLVWRDQSVWLHWYPYMPNPRPAMAEFKLAEPRNSSLRRAIRARFEDVKAYQLRGFRYADDKS